MPHAVASSLHSTSPTRAFGRYLLEAVLAESDATVLWLAVDTTTSAQALLTMPRAAPASPAAVGGWLLAARRAARLDHPHIAPVAECGVHEHWPFVAVARSAGVTLDEWLHVHPHPGVDEATGWLCGVLRGLAFAHDAGIAHHDVQLHGIVIDERGQASVMALGVAPDVQDRSLALHRSDGQAPDGSDSAPALRDADGRAFDGGDRAPVLRDADGRAFDGSDSAPVLRRTDARAVGPPSTGLRAQRAAAERDVLACGLILHRLLVGAPALGVADVGKAIERIAPFGREIARLPWTLPVAVPEALRAIADRSTGGQPRLRYRNARTFLGALAGWRDAQSQAESGPVAQMLDRMQRMGHLPALPDLGRRIQKVTGIGSSRTDQIAQFLLPDLALSFELLRTLNSAHVQGTQIAGNGAVLTLRRVVSLIGINGVRAAANRLRAWPGRLDAVGARRLAAAIDRVRLAGRLAERLRPAGYDAEAVHLVTALQCLSRLLLAYHFADETEQIRQLVRPTAGGRGDAASNAGDPRGLSEDAASYAVLGVGVDAFGMAVARHWGLGEEVLQLIRRVPLDAPVRKPDDDGEALRIVASAAIEAVDALDGPAAGRPATLDHIASRYARALQLTPRALQDALREVTSLTPALVDAVRAAPFPT